MSNIFTRNFLQVYNYVVNSEFYGAYEWWVIIGLAVTSPFWTVSALFESMLMVVYLLALESVWTYIMSPILYVAYGLAISQVSTGEKEIDPEQDGALGMLNDLSN